MYITDPSTLAALLSVSVSDIRAEVRAGRLRAIQVNGHDRIIAGTLEEMLAGLTPSESKAPVPATSETGTAVGLTWVPAPGFAHLWPDSSTEEYPTAYQTDVVVHGTRYPLVIGYGMRDTAGMNRRRVTAFLIRGNTRYPLVEFVGGNEFERDRLLAAVIKVDGKHCTEPEEVPTELASLDIRRYREVVDGPYAARGMAVVVEESDRDGIAAYALFRAEEKDFL